LAGAPPEGGGVAGAADVAPRNWAWKSDIPAAKPNARMDVARIDEAVFMMI
jgi:hypothetical protein